MVHKTYRDKKLSVSLCVFVRRFSGTPRLAMLCSLHPDRADHRKIRSGRLASEAWDDLVAPDCHVWAKRACSARLNLATRGPCAAQAQAADGSGCCLLCWMRCKINSGRRIPAPEVQGTCRSDHGAKPAANGATGLSRRPGAVSVKIASRVLVREGQVCMGCA
jgi:hypothetical protein